MNRLFWALPVLALCGCASYQTKVLRPWLGASKAALVSSWGYPQSAGDIVVIDAHTTVYNYRSVQPSLMSPVPVLCVVSFTLHDDVVVSDKAVGDNCIDNRR